MRKCKLALIANNYDQTHDGIGAFATVVSKNFSNENIGSIYIISNEAFSLTFSEGVDFAKQAITFTIPGSGVNYVNLYDVAEIGCPNCDSKAYAVSIRKLTNDSMLRQYYGENAIKRVLGNSTFNAFEKRINDAIYKMEH